MMRRRSSAASTGRASAGTGMDAEGDAGTVAEAAVAVPAGRMVPVEGTALAGGMAPAEEMVLLAAKALVERAGEVVTVLPARRTIPAGSILDPTGLPSLRALAPSTARLLTSLVRSTARDLTPGPSATTRKTEGGALRAVATVAPAAGTTAERRDSTEEMLRRSASDPPLLPSRKRIPGSMRPSAGSATTRRSS